MENYNTPFRKKLVYYFLVSIAAGLLTFIAYSIGPKCGSTQDHGSKVCKMAEPGHAYLSIAAVVVVFLLATGLTIYSSKKLKSKNYQTGNMPLSAPSTPNTTTQPVSNNPQPVPEETTVQQNQPPSNGPTIG